jgi:CRP-like cAMP-binding protein
MDLFSMVSRWRNPLRGPRHDPEAEGDSPLDLTFRSWWFKRHVTDDTKAPAADARTRQQPQRTDWQEHRPQDLPPGFWDRLEPVEREALRSVASWRTFAAGAKIMEEGGRADHVMVILGGQAKICVDENGRERILAVRGLGQLVGERAALEVSVRSATVVALDMVWALVVQTKDFAAFISTHPRVLDIVQDQQDQLHTRYARNGRAGSPTWPAGDAAGEQPGIGLPPGNAKKRSLRLNGENCTVFLTDVADFASRTRTDGDRLLIREALLNMTQMAMRGFPDARSEDRGDGFLTVVPPDVSTARVLDQLLKELPSALDLYNGSQRESARFKLRLAVNVGPVVTDMSGVSGEAIIVAARLVEAPRFKTALAESTGALGVIASPFVYENVVRHGTDPDDVASYCQVPVEVKESDTTAWMKVFGVWPPSPVVPQSGAPGTRQSLLTATARRPRDLDSVQALTCARSAPRGSPRGAAGSASWAASWRRSGRSRSRSGPPGRAAGRRGRRCQPGSHRRPSWSAAGSARSGPGPGG